MLFLREANYNDKEKEYDFLPILQLMKMALPTLHLDVPMKNL
jgi:hypothetical protein